MPSKKIYTSVPKDYVPFLLKKQNHHKNERVIFVTENEADMRYLSEILENLAPGQTVLKFPGWDCLPYDRVSPRSNILAERAKTLSFIADPQNKPYWVITTVSAFIQKLPPVAYFKNLTQQITVGSSLNFENLFSALQKKHYTRVETVREPGEFSFRGGLVDIFPSDQENPVRLDLFGEEVDSIYTFDSLTQRRETPLNSIELFPISEMFIGDKEKERFKNLYRSHFGSPSSQDEIYQGILEGRSPKGVEHWLPLFYESMISLIDFIGNPTLYLDSSFMHQIENCLEEIQDYFQARLKFQASEGDLIYNPLPPERLYLTQQEISEFIEKSEVFEICPFQLPEREKILDQGVKQLPLLITQNNFEPLKTFLTEQKKKRVILCGMTQGACDRIAHIFKENDIGPFVSYPTLEKAIQGPKSLPGITLLPLQKGFISDDLILIAEQDLFGDRLRKMPKKRKRSDLFIAESSTINIGDFLVHDQHGIGQYQGLQTIDINEAAHDCLMLIYEGGDKLFIPVENLDILTRYGGDTTGAKLDKLGHTAWQARKAKVKKNLLALANHLIKTAAARKYHPTDPINLSSGLYEEFCARFPYNETEDQLQATNEVLTDLQRGEAMDRLICGDVGFGKTEVAMRAAFAIANSGKQVAIITPTTLLCRQHFMTFSQRFAGLDFKIEQLSRLVSSSQASTVKEGLQSGRVQIIVGTHALLSKDLTFANLGLIIVDEEQHFGVKQKERLKELKTDVHVLSMTATPIPRTLQMAMSGVKEMSIIATPPIDRLAVRTFVMPYDSVVIREALLREHNRKGQSFYVSPRTADLADLHKKLTELVPELKIVTAHGKMRPKDLEEVMDAFYQGNYDILLATNIIESGIDIPNANTMIIHRSDLFGLSQLYQLRGRIGRSKTRAYAYFTLSTYHTLTKTAQRRLEVMQTLDSLGAGFQLASHDLDIRGAGNILGDQQSGHIKEIGVELYQQMLQECIEEIKAQKLKIPPIEEAWFPTLNIGIPVLIPENYVKDLSVRLELYRRISHLHNEEGKEEFIAELIDRFGPLPEEVKNLMNIIQLKYLCKQAHIHKIDVGKKGFSLNFFKNSFPNPETLLSYIHQNSTSIKLKPNQSLVFMDTFDSDTDKIIKIKKVLYRLIDLSKKTEAISIKEENYQSI